MGCKAYTCTLLPLLNKWREEAYASFFSMTKVFIPEFVPRPQRFNTLMVMGMELGERPMFWIARFRMQPFTCIGFLDADLTKPYEEMLDEVGMALRGAQYYRSKDPETHILMQHGIAEQGFSAFFCSYVSYQNGRRIVSLCGDMDDQSGKTYKLEPNDRRVRPYTISQEIGDKIASTPANKAVEDTIPSPTRWSWWEAAMVAHLYNEGAYKVRELSTGHPIVEI